MYFQGLIPTPFIEQLIRSIDFSTWPEIFVCCSGTFRAERAILSKWPEAQIVSNDVSLFTVPIGRYAMGIKTPFTFTGELAFVEDAIRGAPYTARLAALVVASDMGQYAAGKQNRYKQTHFAHYRNTFAEKVKETEDKLRRILEPLQIADFYAGDWIDHVKQAIARGAGIIAFPPFVKGGYEKMFEWIGKNVAWDVVPYEIFDPTDLPLILDEIAGSGVPYCLLSDKLIDGHAPTIEYRAGRRLPHYAYVSAAASSYFMQFNSGEPFRYKTIDLARIHKKSVLRVVAASNDQLSYIKDVYLAKGIVHCTGQFNYLVYIDDMLIGGMIFDLGKYMQGGDADELYLLSDLCISSEAKLSKLVARAALSRETIAPMEKLMFRRFAQVSTTAFSRNAVSMKYRGTGLEVTSRRPSKNPLDAPGTNIIQYSGKPTGEDLAATFRWWWIKHGQSEVGKAKGRNPAPRSQELAQTRAEPALHGSG